MAYLFADENFPLPVVARLRELGHVVITMQETGKAGLALADAAVLALAVEHGSALLTLNRRHFIGFHSGGAAHQGIIVCTTDPDFKGLAERIDATIKDQTKLDGELIRIQRQG